MGFQHDEDSGIGGSVPNSATDDEELTNGEPTELVTFCSVGNKEKLRKSGRSNFYGSFLFDYLKVNYLIFRFL